MAVLPERLLSQCKRAGPTQLPLNPCQQGAKSTEQPSSHSPARPPAASGSNSKARLFSLGIFSPESCDGPKHGGRRGSVATVPFGKITACCLDKRPSVEAAKTALCPNLGTELFDKPSDREKDALGLKADLKRPNIRMIWKKMPQWL